MYGSLEVTKDDQAPAWRATGTLTESYSLKPSWLRLALERTDETVGGRLRLVDGLR
jgi:hypothetical protein